LSKLPLPPAEALERLNRLANNRNVHVRGIERLLDEQVNPAVTVNLRAGGGGAMIWDSVMSLLYDILVKAKESSS
jgi:hypothetical protein